jgi:anti-anti-sigma regulatory factor
MTTPLSLDTARGDDGRIALTAVGEIDQSNIDDFNLALTAATTEAAGSGETLTVDLSSVEYLDSAAINALYASSDRIKLIANPLLTRVLTVSGIGELTTIELPPPA